MKKLVTAFALCAAVSAMAVESANVVGYQTVSLTSGEFTHVAPSFISFNGNKEILLSELNGVFAETDSVQIMNSNFGTQSEYFYLESGSLAPEGGLTGWYQDDFTTPAGTVAIPAGTSVLYSSVGGSSLILSGQVNKDNVVIVSGADFNVIGNPFPSPTTLGAIQFVGITETCSVQFMNGIAATQQELFWLESGSLAPEGGLTGWYEDDFTTPAGTKAIAAGAGFLFNDIGGGGTTITILSPL